MSTAQRYGDSGDRSEPRHWGSLGATQHRWNDLSVVIVGIVTLSIGLFGFSLLHAYAAGDDAGEPGRGVADTAAMNLVLLRLIGLYAGLSVLAFGGGNGVIPAARRRLSASLAFRRRVPGYVRHLPRRARAGVADRGESRWHGGRRSSPSPQCSRYPVWPCMVVARY
jgi:hypothetical protein